MLKTLTTTLLTAGLLAAVGCSNVDSPDVGTTQAMTTGASCTSNSGINPLKAALAVAMGAEMGRVDALKDLTIGSATGWRVGVSAEGLARCSARGVEGCPNVVAILDLQKPEVNQFIDQAVLNTTAIREDLRASFDRQRNHEQNLRLNYPSRVPGEYTMTEIGVSNLGACGIHYDFAVAGDKIVNLQERLVFFGGTSNPFLDFRSTESTVSIDPTGTMNGDMTTTNGICTSACTSYTLTLKGTCCTCNAKYGTFQPASWNRNTLYCAT